MWEKCNSLIFMELETTMNNLKKKLQSFNKLRFFTREHAVSPQVIVRRSWKKLLATSLHSGFTRQANTRWRVVSYCAEYQAAGSALRPGLIFYLHSFLLRIFRTIFPALYSQQTTKQGPHLWKAYWIEKKTAGLAACFWKQKKNPTLNRFSHLGLRAGLVIWAWQLGREGGRGKWMNGRRRQLSKKCALSLGLNHDLQTGRQTERQTIT